MLPKKTANNMVTAAIELRFGDADTLAGQQCGGVSLPAAC